MKMKTPSLGPSVPARGNTFSRLTASAAYGITGWHFVGAPPDLPKFVMIVAPHTSNWDFFVGVGALFSLGLKVKFLGKDSIFRWPVGSVMRWLGGIPVDRTVSKDRVAASVAAFNGRDKLVLVMAPEGTRKKVRQWKTGFYHVALGAGVPIVPVAFDYGNKAVLMGDAFFPTGDADGDIMELRRFFTTVTARHPENYAK